jgi:hypothetical protein
MPNSRALQSPASPRFDETLARLPIRPVIRRAMLNRERSTSDADEGSASETDVDGFETALQLGAVAFDVNAPDASCKPKRDALFAGRALPFVTKL